MPNKLTAAKARRDTKGNGPRAPRGGVPIGPVRATVCGVVVEAISDPAKRQMLAAPTPEEKDSILKAIAHAYGGPAEAECPEAVAKAVARLEGMGVAVLATYADDIFVRRAGGRVGVVCVNRGERA